MPEFTFKGVSNGSPASIAVAQAGNTASNAVTAWGQGLAQISITPVVPVEAVAPYGVFLEATGHDDFDLSAGGQPDPTFDGIYYVWTVNGQPLSAFQNSELNIPTAWRNRNLAYGPRVSFVFDQPGTFSVDLWCIELSSGKTAEASWTSDPISMAASTYTNAQTVCFDPSGAFTDAPEGHTPITTTVDLISYLEAGSGGCRVLFPRGSDITFSELVNIESGFTRMHFDAFGSGADPILRAHKDQAFRFTWGGVEVITFSNMRFLGGWDASKEAGKAAGFFEWFSSATNTFIVLDKCEISGQVARLNASTTRFIVHDCYVHDWGASYGSLNGYGIYIGSGGYFGLIGSAVHQNPNACLGSMQGPFGNYGAAVRVPVGPKTVVSMSSMFNTGGWSSGQGGLAAAQPALRLNTGPSSTFEGCLDRIVVEGGFRVTDGVENAGPGGPQAGPTNFVADRVLGLASCTSDTILQWTFNGTWRNTVAMVPNLTHWVGAPGSGTFKALNITKPYNATAALRDAPCTAYNISVMSFDDVYRAEGPVDTYQLGDPDIWSDVTFRNNLRYDPNGGATADGPVDEATVLAGVTPKSIGQRFSVTKPDITLSGDVPSGGTVTVPYPERRWKDPADNSYKVTQLANTDMDDALTLHQVRWDGGGWDIVRHASDGAIAVDFSNPAHAVLTNLTGETWPSGRTLRVNLVPKDSANPTYTEYASPTTIPLPRPLAGSDAIDDGDASPSAYDDFLAVERPGENDDRGALLFTG